MKIFTDIMRLLDEDKALEFLQRTIQFNTTNPPGAEKALAHYIADTLNSYGIKSHVVDLGEQRGNVIGRVAGLKDRPALLFNGHLDVVPPGEQVWKHDPFSGTIDSGKVYGRGTADMKAGFAAMVMAAALIVQAGIVLKGDLVIAGTAGEETDSLGAWSLLNSGYIKDIGAVAIAEPTLGKLFLATKGILWSEYTTVGKTAHASMPDLGNNAILHMNAVIGQLANYSFTYCRHPVLTPPTMNIGTIIGGVKTNVVPDSCVLTVDIRTVPGQEHDQIIRDLQSIVTDLEQEVTGFKGSLKVIKNCPGVETPLNNEFMQQGIRAAGKALSQNLVPCGVNYYTDASVFAPALGIPFIIYGPGDEKMAHQPDEYVEIERYFDAIKFYVALVLEYLT